MFLGQQVNCQGTVTGSLDRQASVADGGVDGSMTTPDAQNTGDTASGDAASGDAATGG